VSAERLFLQREGVDMTSIGATRPKARRVASPAAAQEALRRWVRSVVAWLAVALAAAGLLASWGLIRSAPDAWVGANVKMSLIASDQVGGVPIGVDACNGRVTLHGAVRSNVEREEALRITSHVSGVKGVRDLLQIVPMGERRAVRLQDDRLRRHVELALGRDRDLARLDVKSVHSGLVLVRGHVESFTTHLRALETIALVPGVRRVASEIRSPDLLSDDEIWYDDSTPAKAKPSAEHGDEWITGHAQLRFLADPDAQARDVNVDTHEGHIVLFGMVPSHEARTAAEKIAGDVPGVRGVRNELRVVPAAKRDSAVQADDALRQTIVRRITERLPAASISVEVRAAVVRLQGTVERSADRFAALMLAHSTDGVRSVDSDLRVDRP